MLRTEEMEINMGPQHPSTHGVLRVILKLSDGLQMWPSQLAELTEIRWEQLRDGNDGAEPLLGRRGG